jgi:hypothetical protein
MEEVYNDMNDEPDNIDEINSSFEGADFIREIVEKSEYSSEESSEEEIDYTKM